jgi:predicted alpha/beta superfamily hydrolase
MKPSGGNERFLQFIREELMPYVNSHYKTEPNNILAGHSFGGLAAVYCLSAHPEMFQMYISVSPSLWWDREYVLKLADQKLKKGAVLNKKLFLSDANEGVSDSSTFHTNVLKLDAILKAKTLTGLHYQYNYYSNETHMTEPLPAYYDALRFIYKDWKNP